MHTFDLLIFSVHVSSEVESIIEFIIYLLKYMYSLHHHAHTLSTYACYEVCANPAEVFLYISIYIYILYM